ncbi:hypothetical protein BGZ94_001131 [Podila epigama]|nr:hypothetical protein BGZ94_001131 [Podila epigama]
MVFSTADIGFKQDVPQVQNTFLEDPVMVSVLERLLPSKVLQEITPDLVQICEWANTEGAALVERMEADQPRLRQYDHWCRRVDDLFVTEAWKKQKEIAAKEGVVAIAYERKYGEFSRIYQMAKLMLWTSGSGLYSCPIAMTVWDPSLQAWSISGFKWFSSATDADVTMLLARTHDPAAAPGTMRQGSKGLSLYLANVRDEEGKLNGIRIHRLKDKVGTKALPTAELELDRMVAQQVGDKYRGVKNISAILNITRVYCGMGCTAAMQRFVLGAKDYARRREVFGNLLKDQPLHLATLANMELQYRASSQFTFFCAAMLGRIEVLDNNLPQVKDHDIPLLRLLTPILKVWSAKHAFAMSQEAMEAFGGQGYMEETGLGRAMRDVLVNTIWEGTTNVLSLDVLRVMAETGGDALDLFVKTVRDIMAPLKNQPQWSSSAKSLNTCLDLISGHFGKYATIETRALLEASARGLTFAMADTLAGALLCQHAAWSAVKAQRVNDANSIVAIEANIDQISAQRWCEGLDRKVAFQIEALGNEQKYEEDKMMLFGLADARTLHTAPASSFISPAGIRASL